MDIIFDAFWVIVHVTCVIVLSVFHPEPLKCNKRHRFKVQYFLGVNEHVFVVS